MLNQKKCVCNLNYFLQNFFTNTEVTSTELTNFLNEYVKYILLCNNLSPEDVHVQLHFIKDFSLDEASPYQLKIKRKTTHRQRNKENAKNNTYHKGLRFIAFVTGYTNSKNFDIYLNKELCKIKSDKDIESFVSILYSLGHEVEHINQFFNQADLCDAVDICEENQIEEFEKTKEKLIESPKLIRRLANKFQNHSDNFSVLNSTEILADEAGYYYFEELIKIIESESADEDFILFINYILEGLAQEHKYRKYFYHQTQQHEDLIYASLVKEFNIPAHVLDII